MKIIYLNGFMASGKSTIGPILANTLGWEFFDLDKVIEEEIGKKVVDIFRDEGEEFFRRKESETLQQLSKSEFAVISLGGGTATFEQNIEILRKTGKVIYLKTSVESLYKRLRNKKDRPLFNEEISGVKKEEIKDRIIRLLDMREPYYRRADYIINTDEYPLGVTVDKIVKLLRKSL